MVLGPRAPVWACVGVVVAPSAAALPIGLVGGPRIVLATIRLRRATRGHRLFQNTRWRLNSALAMARQARSFYSESIGSRRVWV